jgi:Stress responsive A/B Barrel Domain
LGGKERREGDDLLRHTALFLWRDTTDDAAKLAAKKGLAYLAYGCPSVRSVDFGTDLLGGSSRLLEVKPWERTPLWDARTEGPPSRFDMALHLDFDDQHGLDEYNKDEVHHEVALYNASVCRPERTARVDWWYDGSSRFERAGVRSTTLYLWDDEATDARKDDVRRAYGELQRAVPGLDSILVADNVGTLRTDYDLIVDAHFETLEHAKVFVEHEAHREAEVLAATSTKYEWTARITHTMASG